MVFYSIRKISIVHLSQLLGALFCALLILMFAGCNGGGGGSDSSDTETEQTVSGQSNQSDLSSSGSGAASTGSGTGSETGSGTGSETGSTTGTMGTCELSWNRDQVPITGLGYSSASYSGVTDANGQFHYREGETVAFFVGTVELGFTRAGNIIKLKDLLSGETKRENTFAFWNMLGFLVFIDHDGDISNGCQISETVASKATFFLDFYIPENDFSEALSRNKAFAQLVQSTAAHYIPEELSIGTSKVLIPPSGYEEPIECISTDDDLVEVSVSPILGVVATGISEGSATITCETDTFSRTFADLTVVHPENFDPHASGVLILYPFHNVPQQIYYSFFKYYQQITQNYHYTFIPGIVTTDVILPEKNP